MVKSCYCNKDSFYFIDFDSNLRLADLFILFRLKPIICLLSAQYFKPFIENHAWRAIASKPGFTYDYEATDIWTLLLKREYRRWVFDKLKGALLRSDKLQLEWWIPDLCSHNCCKFQFMFLIGSDFCPLNLESKF